MDNSIAIPSKLVLRSLPINVELLELLNQKRVIKEPCQIEQVVNIGRFTVTSQKPETNFDFKLGSISEPKLYSQNYIKNLPFGKTKSTILDFKDKSRPETK